MRREYVRGNSVGHKELVELVSLQPFVIRWSSSSVVFGGLIEQSKIAKISDVGLDPCFEEDFELSPGASFCVLADENIELLFAVEYFEEESLIYGNVGLVVLLPEFKEKRGGERGDFFCA